MTANQSAETLFICSFCRYRSGLSLRECPECGKVTGQIFDKNQLSAPETKYQPPSLAKRRSHQSRSGHKVSEQQLYTCKNCRYQTPNSLPECPECGKRSFSQKVVVTSLPTDRRIGTKTDMEQFGKFVQYIGIGLFPIAFLVFWGVGPTGQRYPRSGIIAKTGEQWIGGLIIVIVAFIIIFFGSYLKKK
jgi:predicted ATP-dependent serine protease